MKFLVSVEFSAEYRDAPAGSATAYATVEAGSALEAIGLAQPAFLASLPGVGITEVWNLKWYAEPVAETFLTLEVTPNGRH